MKRTYKLLKITAIISVIFVILTTFGVFATWHYATGGVNPTTEELKMTVFPWTGQEELPDDVQGAVHTVLIEAVLNGKHTDANGKVTEIGLNNPNSYLNTEIKDRSSGWFTSDTLGSMDFWQNDNIAKYFDLETENLSFLLYFPEGVDDTYYLFTTSIELGAQNSPNIPINTNIYPIYRTILQKDETGKYVAIETKTGYAKSAYYSNVITGSFLIRYPSFNPDTWSEGKLGTTKSNAIYVFVGETFTAYHDTNTEKSYYSLSSVTAGKYITISTDNADAVFNVYNSRNNNVINDENLADSTVYSFTAQNNVSYIIEVSGDTSITFTITST